MTINYPNSIDNDANLLLAHDALRVTLLNDYNPGDTSITIKGDPIIISRWPQNGIITLTEQCSDINDRAISFSYTAFDNVNGVFSGLVLLPGFNDNFKAKNITHVTQNIVADFHNNIKDALIAIETFVGKKGTVDPLPLGSTMEGRINFLRKLVLSPKAWFSVDVQTGIAPFTATFTDLSFRLGTDGQSGPVTLVWDFGDNTTQTVTLQSPAQVGTTYTKTYVNPGVYTVTLTVTNAFGQDQCKFTNLITARTKAPNEVVAEYNQSLAGQIVIPGTPSGGPYQVVPRIRAPINSIIEIIIPSGPNPATPGFSYAGEPLNNLNDPIDPITSYTWSLGDDLSHPNSHTTTAVYSVGGVYDMKVRVDTTFGAYRITTYQNSIDIVENYNLWLWTFQDNVNVRSFEFGLISQTFKANSTVNYLVNRNSSFLNNVPNSAQQIKEFNKNTGFAPRGTLNSGRMGTAVLYWASGRNVTDSPSTETINMVEYNAFRDTYTARSPISRPWNWAGLNSTTNSYFLFGETLTIPAANTSPTNQVLTSLDLNSYTTSNVTLSLSNYLNGAQELQSNPAIYDTNGNSTYGNYSIYRTAWKDSTGYLARNDGVGPFFRIRSFYRTEGTVGTPVQNIRKMSDILGTTKEEGEIASMSGGVYFFNNSGSFSVFDDTSNIWTTGGPGVNSVAYSAFQDTSVDGFNDPTNTLLLASDGDSRAYISFDYSTNAFIKFNQVGLSFSTLGARPAGQQWIMGIF